MKRTLLLSFLSIALFTSHQSVAQLPGVSKVQKALPKVDIGLKAGANFQQLNGTGWKKSYNPGIFGGVFVGVHKGKIGVQAEALLKSVKYEYNVSATAPVTRVNALYLDVPVMFQYRLIPHLWVQVGPQFSMILTAKNNLKTDVKNTFASSDISGVLGIEARLPMRINVGGRYILGFSDMNNTVSTAAWRNRSVQVYVGFRFL